MVTENGATREVVEDMVNGLLAAERRASLPLAYMVAALVFTDKADLQWLKERFAMLEDLFQDTWVYQDIFHKGEQLGKEEGELTAWRQAVLGIAKTRFPEIEVLAQRQIEAITDADVLHTMLLRIGAARTVHEAVNVLFAAEKEQE